MLAGADDERPVGRDDALAGADRVLVQLGGRQVGADAPAQRVADAALSRAGRVVLVVVMTLETSQARTIAMDRPAARDAGPGERVPARVGFRSRVGGDATHGQVAGRVAASREPVPTRASEHAPRSVALTLGHPARSIRTQPKSAYQEWQRDRPDEATTTYRRDVGKVPSPGRSACEIRDSFGDPDRPLGLSVPPVLQATRPLPGDRWR